ncbi:MAG: hypothetical protein KKF44_03945 [Nanoarchaeota archaeon]|nr:hypothetical protein [Nanoarchaeota archaeon]
MFDIVLPQNNELGIIKMAETLGWKELCLAYDRPTDIASFRRKTVIKLISGVVAEPGAEQRFVGKCDIILSKTFDASTVRTLCERGFAQIFFGLEQSPKPDFMHHRNSGLNHVICEIMKEKGISIALDFSSILNSGGKQRAVLLGRMKQNLVFAKKYALAVVIATFAKEPLEMRAPNTFTSFLNLLSLK